MIMIKDNHISVAGGVANAMRSVDQFLEKEKLTLPVEVLFNDTKIGKDVNTSLCIHVLMVHLLCLV